MYSLWINICFFQLLIALNTTALKVIPGIQQVIKANGTTRTISKFFIHPEDDLKNQTTLEENERYTKFLRALIDEDYDNKPNRKVDRYKIYINRKFRHSKPLVKYITRPVSDEGGSKTSKHRYSVKMTRFRPNTVHHYYRKVVTKGGTADNDNSQNRVSAKTAVVISNKLRQEGESREASKDSSSEEVAAGGLGVESNKAQSVNKTEEIKHLETVAAYGDLTKPLNYENKELYQAPAAIDESGTVTTLLQKAQINHLNEKIPVQVNGNMHTVYEGTKNQEEQSNSQQEDTEHHKQNVIQEINPLNIQMHNLLQSKEVSQSLDTSSEDISGKNVEQTPLLIDHYRDQDRPLMRKLVFQNGPSLSAYESNNNILKLNPLNNYFHHLHGQDNIYDGRIPHAGISKTISSPYSYSGSPYSTYINPGSFDHLSFSPNAPHGNYGIISASPQSSHQFMELPKKHKGLPHKHNWTKFHKVTGNANVDNNPYYEIQENFNNPAPNKIKKLSQPCPECFNKLYAESLQQEQRKHLGGPSKSNEYLLQLLNKDPALLSYLQSPEQHQHYNRILHLLQNSPVKVDPDFENQEHPSQILPIDASSGDIYVKEALGIPFRPVTLNQRLKPGYINKKPTHIMSNYNNGGQMQGPYSGIYPEYGPHQKYQKIHSPFDYMYQKPLLRSSHSHHEQIHSSPDDIGQKYIPNLILVPTDHIDKKETDVYPETDDNLASTLYPIVKQHTNYLEPIPNIPSTVANLQKYLDILERNPKLNEDVQKFEFYKIIKLLITIFKAQTENDVSVESSWFNQLSPYQKYRIEQYVYNLLKETWFQEILIELEKNNYNFNILKESEPLTDWQIPVNVFDADDSDDNIENNNDDNHEKVSDQEHHRPPASCPLTYN